MDRALALRWPPICCLCLAVLVGVPGLANCQEKERSGKWTPETLLVSESLSKNCNLPIVTVRVAGKDRRFLVHTGGGFTQLDKSLCVDLKPFQRLDGVELSEEERALGLRQPPPMELGRLRLNWISCVEPLDRSDISKETGQKIEGTLGMEVLKELVLQIDADHDVLQIASPSQHNPPPGIHFPLDIDEDFNPRLVCAIAPGKLESFIINTNRAANGSLDQRCAEYVLKNGGAAGRDVDVYAPNGYAFSMRTVVVPDVAFGNVSLRKLQFNVRDSNQLDFDSLLRCRIAFDFKNKHAYCLPSKVIASRDGHSQFGMVFDLKKPLGTVYSVEKGLAGDAGLAAGDRILHINGISVESKAFQAFRMISAPTSAPIVLDVDRGGRRLKVTLPSER